MVNIYITVGATIPFDGMINTIFQDFNESLSNHLLAKKSEQINIIAQCGSTYNSLYEKNIETQVDLKAAVDLDSEYSKSLNTKEMRSVSYVKDSIKINIAFFNLSSNLGSFLKKYNPDIVISHAGTGSLLDALGNQKNDSVSIIAVVNESLMNNHQLEIGEKLEKYGVLTCCKNLGDLRERMCTWGFAKPTNTQKASRSKLQRGYNENFNSGVLMF